MKTATVRDLRTSFPSLQALLFEGQEIAITKRKRVVARLLPAGLSVSKPDFRARFGGAAPAPGRHEKSAVQMLCRDRGE